MSNLSNVEEIELSSCKLGPRFPKWIQTLKKLSSINIANTRISDTVPKEFWSMGINRFVSNFDSESSTLDLSSNNFYGPIKNVSPALQKLDLSRNKFNGDISFLCQIVDGSLFFLDLSHNSFTGQIPDCLWHFKKLKLLSLGYNNLSGRLPASFKYLIDLEVLSLYKNSLYGEFPLSLKSCTKLTFLELGANNFVGYVPLWIGEKLSKLYALSLTSNNFFGIIPSQLCRLANLQILDMSLNNLYGTIPSCLNNLTSMVQNGFSPHQNVHYFNFRSGSEYVDHALIKWQGTHREFGITLGLVKIINLSSNNLTGKIPNELSDLHKLIALDLSLNALDGEIPLHIGEMKELLILDLSRNNLSGGIPSSMSHMTLLNYLDVSYNNLSGRIPSGTQLQSFKPSSYIENARLCGLPLSIYCPGDKELEGPPIISENKNDEEGTDDLQKWFYIGGAYGFSIGFWIVCIALLVYCRGRHAFFHIMDISENWVYVKVMVFISKS
ncbi:putative leucine-rich repeat domain superfamily [Helianthus debilis subsp. tardiflorus]